MSKLMHMEIHRDMSVWVFSIIRYAGEFSREKYKFDWIGDQLAGETGNFRLKLLQ